MIAGIVCLACITRAKFPIRCSIHIWSQKKMQSRVWYVNINPRKYVFLGLFIQTLKGLKTVEESDGESLLVNSGSLHTTSWGKLYGSLWCLRAVSYLYFIVPGLANSWYFINHMNIVRNTRRRTINVWS